MVRTGWHPGEMEKLQIRARSLQDGKATFLEIIPTGGDVNGDFCMFFRPAQAKLIRDALRSAINDLDIMISDQTHDELLAATGHEGALARPGDS